MRSSLTSRRSRTFFVLAFTALFASHVAAKQRTSTPSVLQQPLSPAMATLGINGMTTGAMLATSWTSQQTGLLYRPSGADQDIHAEPQWQIVTSGLVGGITGVGLGYINAYLVPPQTSSVLMAQTVAHLAMPLMATGSILVLNPSSSWSGLLFLAGTAATLPISFTLGHQNMNTQDLRTGHLFALNLALATGGTLSLLSPYGTQLKLPTLKSRSIDVAVGGFLIAGAAGMIIGPLGHSHVRPQLQNQMSRILWGGLFGSSLGWICGLTFSSIGNENEFANASMVALGGQALGGIIGAFSKMEEE